ncbi:MAG TPA: glycosyltransferase family 2 protein [Streptosporangiaceae bacterium]|nr:glycosyltransferase family 2 protein [Streptosporangiaceae bacterium]
MISIVVISKDEPGIDDTLVDITAQCGAVDGPCEIIVVDASEGRLDFIRRRHEAAVRWEQFRPQPGVSVAIPHQRNAGVRMSSGNIIVFTDAGCRPEPGWLNHLVYPLYCGERITTGLALTAAGGPGLYGRGLELARSSRYLTECATINLAFHRDAFDAIGGFDERFAYGSDVDFSWRLVEAGYRIRSVPEAVVLRQDWGTWRRQLRRSYAYGRARARLYRKHRTRMWLILRTDPTVLVYPAFLLGLPLILIFPLYPALLLIPAWRNRSIGAARVVAGHLTFGAGVLAEVVSR